MSIQWREQLAEAAIAIDSEQILQLINLIPKDKKDLAQTLTKMLDRFEYDEILELVQAKLDLIKKDGDWAIAPNQMEHN